MSWPCFTIGAQIALGAFVAGSSLAEVSGPPISTRAGRSSGGNWLIGSPQGKPAARRRRCRLRRVFDGRRDVCFRQAGYIQSARAVLDKPAYCHITTDTRAVARFGNTIAHDRFHVFPYLCNFAFHRNPLSCMMESTSARSSANSANTSTASAGPRQRCKISRAAATSPARAISHNLRTIPRKSF